MALVNNVFVIRNQLLTNLNETRTYPSDEPNVDSIDLFTLVPAAKPIDELKEILAKNRGYEPK